MTEWAIEPAKLRAAATDMMLYYKHHAGLNQAGLPIATPFYRAMCRAQVYIERLQDEGARLKATELEAWLPSQRDMHSHTVSRDSCTCEGHGLNHVYCVHMAVFDLILMVMAGTNTRRV